MAAMLVGNMSGMNENDDPTSGGTTMDDMLNQDLPEDEETLGGAAGQPGFAPVFGTEEEHESTASQKVNAFFNKTVGDDISVPAILVIILGIVMAIGFLLSIISWFRAQDDRDTYYPLMVAGFFMMVLCIIGLTVLLLLEHMVGGVKMFRDRLASRGQAVEEEEEEYLDSNEAPAYTPDGPAEDGDDEGGRPEEHDEDMSDDSDDEEMEELEEDDEEELEELEEDEDEEDEKNEEPEEEQPQDSGMVMPSGDSGFIMPDKK